MLTIRLPLHMARNKHLRTQCPSLLTDGCSQPVPLRLYIATRPSLHQDCQSHVCVQSDAAVSKSDSSPYAFGTALAVDSGRPVSSAYLIARWINEDMPGMPCLSASHPAVQDHHMDTQPSESVHMLGEIVITWGIINVSAPYAPCC